MKIFSFSWKEVAPHLPYKRFIIVARDRSIAMMMFKREVSRVQRFYELDESGDLKRITAEGEDHQFKLSELEIKEGQIILDTA